MTADNKEGIMKTSQIFTPRIFAISVAAFLLAGNMGAAETPDNMLVVGQRTTDIQTMDPAFSFGYVDIEVVSNVYDRLVVPDRKAPETFVPEIAEKWEFSSDGSKLTFHIRDGLKFHSGNPVTAEDVAFSIKRIVMLDASATRWTQRFGWTKENVEDAVKAVDPMTVEFNLLNKMAPPVALGNISTVMGSVVDKKLVMENERDGDFGSEWLKNHTAGSGPFKVDTFSPAAEGIVLAAYPDYLLGMPPLAKVVLRNIPESSAQRLLLEKGDIDIARDLSRDQLQAIRDAGTAKVQTDKKWELIYLITNRNHPALGHPKVAEALHYLIDYQGMADSFLRDEMVVHQTFWPGESQIPNIYSLDVEKAKSLLASAGYEDGFTFRLEVNNESPWPEIGQSIKSTMAQAGINVDLVMEAYTVQAGNVRSRKFDAALSRTTGEFPDPDTFSNFFWNPNDSDEAALSSVTAWWAHWNLPGLSRITEMARSEADPEKREQLYTAFQYSVQQESPLFPLFLRNYQTAMSEHVRGFAPLPFWGGVYYDTVSKE